MRDAHLSLGESPDVQRLQQVAVKFSKPKSFEFIGIFF